MLQFLGCGAAFNAALGTNAAFFTHNGSLYLLDCGETVFERAKLAGLLDDAKEIYVAVTHFHSDHVGSLGTLLGYCHFILKKPATVIHPSEQLKTLMTMMGMPENQYRWLPSLDADGVRIQPVPVAHGDLPAWGFEVTCGDKTVFYSGDASELPMALVEALASGRVSRAYLDACDAPTSALHMTICGLQEQVPFSLREKITLMHLNHDYTAFAKAQGFACATDLLLKGVNNHAEF